MEERRTIPYVCILSREYAQVNNSAPVAIVKQQKANSIGATAAVTMLLSVAMWSLGYHFECFVDGVGYGCAVIDLGVFTR